MSTVILRTNKHVLPRHPIDIPHRLTSIIPPINFGAILNGQVYRSGFPQPQNVKFMQGMKLKTVLCLVDTETSREFSDFIDENGIRRVRLDIAANKDGKVKSSLDSVYEALLVVMDVANYPLLIHCNQGRHRTGCLVACLRKMQGWSSHAAIDEYRTYSNPKAREGDEILISDVFQPEAMLEYAKSARFDHRPSLVHLLRSDLVNVNTLVKVLASMDGVLRDHESLNSNTSSKADSGVDFGPNTENEDKTIRIVDFANMELGKTVSQPVSDFAVIIEECGPLSPPL